MARSPVPKRAKVLDSGAGTMAAVGEVAKGRAIGGIG